MPKVSREPDVPAFTIAGRPPELFNYFDSFRVSIANNQISIDEIFYLSGKFQPNWIRFLVRIRNFLAPLFGIKPGQSGAPEEYRKAEVGAKAGFFRIINKNENEIVFGENDTHLYFESSLLLATERESNMLYCLTFVKYHNLAGRVYFFLIKPFHRLIIRSLLNDLQKTIDKS